MENTEVIIEENEIELSDAGPVVEEFWVTRTFDGKRWYAVTDGGGFEYDDFATAVEAVKASAQKTAL